MGNQLRDRMRVTVTPRPANTTERLDSSVAAAKARERKAIQLLGDLGAIKGSQLTELLGYKAPSSAAVFLAKLIKKGTIVRTKRYYHLKGQEVPGIVKTNKECPFFDYPGKLGELRRYMKLHQDEPITIADVSRSCGYASESGAHNPIYCMMKNDLLRRYKAPEDWGPVWRYQYIPEELSGVKTIVPARTVDELEEFLDEHNDNTVLSEEVPWIDEEEIPAAKPIDFAPFLDTAKRADEMVNEVNAQQGDIIGADQPEAIVNELTTTINLVEKYGKEFFWQTGSRDTKELLIWLKERRLAGVK